MATNPEYFRGAYGDRLAARVDLPVGGRPRAWVLFAHCFTCSKDVSAAVSFSRAMNREGIAVFRFDFTGLGESEGDFADTNFSSNVQDLEAAGRHMKDAWSAPDLLVGHSLGGAAALHAARALPSVRAVATIAAPSDPAAVLQHVSDSRSEIETRGEAEVTLAGRSFTIRRQLLEDLVATNMRESVAGLDRALLILHSPVDAIVGVENAAELYRMAKHPKSFVSLDDADHLLTRPTDARYAARVLAAWASRYLDLEPKPPPTTTADAGEEQAAPPESPVPGERAVVRIGRDHYRTEVWADGHYLVADEPKAKGGRDEGPGPYDLLVAGLGSCTAITLRMYADRKEWPLAEVRVVLRHTRQHASDGRASDDEGHPRRIDRIDRELTLIGDLDAEQRGRLLEIADRCPVHRTMTAGVEVVTVLKDA